MSIQDLRKKLKPVPVASLEEQDRQLDQTMGRNSGGDTKQLKIDVGRNVFRFFPPHEPLDVNGKPNPFAEPKVIVYLPAYVAERDEQGKEIVEGGKTKMKLSVKPVFNAKVHGKKDKLGNSLTKDLVEEFIRLANEKAKTLATEDEKKKFLLPIYGNYSKDKTKNINGITYRQSWEIWALKMNGQQGVFGKLEIGKAVKNALNKIAAVESANEPLGTDPFTDLESGRAVVIVYNNQADKPEDYYTTMIDNSTEDVELEGGRKARMLKVYPITDEQLLEFSNETSLEKMFRNVFKRRDLDLQLTGLKMLDDKNKMGIFETDEFQAIAEELSLQYPPDATDESTTEEPSTDNDVMTSQTPANNTTASTTVQTTTDLPFENEAHEPDEFDVMTRDELKEFNKDNGCGVIIKPASIMSDNDIRERLRSWTKSQSVVVDTTTMPESFTKHLGENTASEEVVTETTTVRPLTPKERLEALKSKQTAAK